MLHTNPSPAQQTIPSPNEDGEGGDIADEGRGGTSCPGGGGDYSSDSDDDLDVTWEDDSFGAAGDVDAAAGAKPAMAESRGGSFGGGEQNAPSSSSSSSSRNNSSYSSAPSRKPSSKSVSYTHLTLPTILLV